MKGFSGSWILAVELILALVAYGLIKRMEAKERIRCHEHGLIKEFQKNWVLFLMLIQLCVFFLINSYLPMIGIYFAMERFVKKKAAGLDSAREGWAAQWQTYCEETGLK